MPGFGPGAAGFAPPPGGLSASSFGTAPAGFTFGTPPAPFSLPSAPAFTPQLPQSGGTGISFFFTVGSADQQKAQAVRAMQTYESSLNGSSRLIDDARGAVPQAAATPSAPVPPRQPETGRRGAWQRLTGGGVEAVAVRHERGS
ncbi:hypothetical protein [Lentzea guizhouensis]|uniref:hypothetical protein n=1 Tax=Lentzea guizhouensis TaxID=1586287 RepID=UPI0012B6A4A7|nr:hypothetical protein [Lentzea guizhouensis]